MNYLVSIIIPVYNCENYLERAIKSVITQSMFNESELILVDDGSSDKSSSICDYYTLSYDNIKVIHQCNMGVSAARNEGINMATGKWVCFLDSDDYLLSNALELIKEYPDSDIVCTSYQSNVTINTIFDSELSGTFMFDDIKSKLVNTLASHQDFYTCWSKFYKKEILLNNNIKFPVDRKLAEDMVFVYTYLSVCKLISFSDKSTYFYFVNANNTTNIVKESFDTFKFIYDWKTEYFINNGMYSEDIKNRLIGSFVWNCFLSLKSEATYSTLSVCINNLKHCFNDRFFIEMYHLTDYREFKTFSDKLLDWSIRHKSPLPFCLISKLNILKSKFLR